jgi:hypothetical protein
VVETRTGIGPLTDLITTTTPNAMVISAATQSNAGTLTATERVTCAMSASASHHRAWQAVTPRPSRRDAVARYSGTSGRIAMVLAAFPVGAPAVPPE